MVSVAEVLEQVRVFVSADAVEVVKDLMRRHWRFCWIEGRMGSDDAWVILRRGAERVVVMGDGQCRRAGVCW